MTSDTDIVKDGSHFPRLSLDEQANLVEKHRVETLLFCPNLWTVCHFFVNQDTREVARAHCNCWDCLFCGPRKADTWRQLVKAADAVLHAFDAGSEWRKYETGG